MFCAARSSVYAFVIGSIICAQGAAFESSAKDSKGDKSVTSAPDGYTETMPAATAVEPVKTFQWQEHNKLSWGDFKGPVNARSEESAAATHCGMGFKVNPAAKDSKSSITVYNTFYVNKSWVRSDAKIESILVHEQGHFDLCELYTRKLKQQMADIDLDTPGFKDKLMAIFTAVNSEYEQAQQTYEHETIHGTDIAQQQKWVTFIHESLDQISLSVKI